MAAPAAWRRKLGEIHHGADDNASGVAGVLELARIFSAQNLPAARDARSFLQPSVAKKKACSAQTISSIILSRRLPIPLR